MSARATAREVAQVAAEFVAVVAGLAAMLAAAVGIALVTDHEPAQGAAQAAQVAQVEPGTVLVAQVPARPSRPAQPVMVGPCPTDDGEQVGPCYWNAARQGNGQGRSFLVSRDGSITYVPTYVLPDAGQTVPARLLAAALDAAQHRATGAAPSLPRTGA